MKSFSFSVPFDPMTVRSIVRMLIKQESNEKYTISGMRELQEVEETNWDYFQFPKKANGLRL
ncbi:hypothetical protein M5K25_023646 [Dendrobium thyrsiflorum]|uniref:Uncharacterized protein n=1 Tax=Dendrobium thyrsiflorum TaxID=117978 RepID=A0ABD0U8I9_DENTH